MTASMRWTLPLTMAMDPATRASIGDYWLSEALFKCKKVLWDDWLASSHSDVFLFVCIGGCKDSINFVKCMACS